MASTGQPRADASQGFLSYVRRDDKYFAGGISRLRQELQEAVDARTTRPFRIFQDVEDIATGELWSKKLDQALESAQLFIPILTPRFFASDFCRRETLAFLEHEARAGRDDLVLPIYLMTADVFEQEALRRDDELAARLHERQFRDWRRLAAGIRGGDIWEEVGALADDIAAAAKRATAPPNGDPPTPEPANDIDPLIEREMELRRDALVRERPDGNAARLQELRQGTLVHVVGQLRGGSWYRVEPRGGEPGYVIMSAFDAARDEPRLEETSAKFEPPRPKDQTPTPSAANGDRPLTDEADQTTPRAATTPRTLRGAIASGALLLLVGGAAWLYWGNQSDVEGELAEAVPVSPASAETFRDCAECPEMVVIPVGRFAMGSPANEAGRAGYEGPQREVTIGQRFALGRYEVTFAEWDACVADGGCSHEPDDGGWGRGDRPVINVSWEDAQSYVSWLSETTGERYRLPSEAEWEYAARAGTTTAFWWGGEIGSGNANCDGCGSEWDNKQTAPVGSFVANEFGLHDTAGNVWEWVEDCGNASYEGAPSDGSAWLQGNCDSRVLRGGPWSSGPGDLRSASRGGNHPDGRGSILGFRVARTVTP